jgi:hypothetical protein
MHKVFWWEKQKERDQQEDRDVSGRITLRSINSSMIRLVGHVARMGEKWNA